MSKYDDEFGDQERNMARGFAWKGRARLAVEGAASSFKDKLKGLTTTGFARREKDGGLTPSAADIKPAAKPVIDTIAPLKPAAPVATKTNLGSVPPSGKLPAPSAGAASASMSTAAASTVFADDYEHEGGFAGFLSRLFGPRGEAWIGALALLFTLGVTGAVVKDALGARFKDKTGVKRIIPARWNDRTLAFPIEGVDAQGRHALFDVVVLTKNYGWTLGSTEELERGTDKLSPQEIESEVLAPQLREGLSRAKELIAVGVASQEGNVEKETHRAGLRAKRTAEWVKQVVPEHIPMWTLNLGRYMDICADCEDPDTSWQRPFAVIAVKQADAGINLVEALQNAMSDKENLPSPNRYSSFSLAKWGKT